MSYNRAILVGRLTRDPEIKQTPNGISVTTFTIAIDRPRDKTTTDFIDIVAWRNTAEFISRYFGKGKAILVEGSIQTRSYTDKNSRNRKVFEVVADNVSFVESKGTEQAQGDTQPTATPLSPQIDDFEELDDDGDLPF